MVAQRFPEASLQETILRWAGELMEETECGFALLDAVFPEDLEVDYDEQPDIFLAALGKTMDPDFSLPTDFPLRVLKPLQQAFASSCLGILVE